VAKRIYLLVDDSRIATGVSHEIYRYEEPGITPALEDTPLISFEEETAELSVCNIYDEVLSQDEYQPNCFHATRVICDDEAVGVSVDDILVDPEFVSIDYETGRIWINDRVIPHYYASLVTATYSYHAFLVKDSEEPQEWLTFTGPVATGLVSPTPAQAEWDSVEAAVKVSWDPAAFVPEYYYVGRMSHTDGRVSIWSAIVNTTLIQEPNVLTYVVERLEENASWTELATQDLFLHDGIFLSPMVHDVTPVFTIVLDTEVDIVIANPFLEPDRTRETVQYRVSVRDDLYAQSEAPTAVAATLVPVPMTQIVLRRKEHNGTPTSFDGLDAVTLIDELSTNVDPELTYNDNTLTPATYCYTLFILDETGEMVDSSWVVDTELETITPL
jgi:hypothetical protein